MSYHPLGCHLLLHTYNFFVLMGTNTTLMVVSVESLFNKGLNYFYTKSKIDFMECGSVRVWAFTYGYKILNRKT